MDLQKKIALIYSYVLINKRKKRKYWHKSWLGDYQRLKHSFTFTLEPVLLKSSEDDFKIYSRLPPNVYFDILEKISPFITKQNRSRLAISPKEKFSLTLSFLSEGLSLRRLAYEFRVGVSTAFNIINETINALLHVLVPEYLQIPSEPEQWNSIIKRFEEDWNFPNCIGALDGKHVQMFPPRNSGSLYYNYKEGFSVVLLGLVDANYKFIAVDVGANGRCSDSGIWGISKIRQAVYSNEVNLPPVTVLPTTNIISPYVILGDSGFPLEEFLMRPYPEKNMTPRERVFNYRLSRARRVSENPFGILANRWRILLQRQLTSPEKATSIVMVCCALHNMMCSLTEVRNAYIPEDFVDREDTCSGNVIQGLWRKEQLTAITPRKTTNYNSEARIIRDKLKNYFAEEGKVAWQDKSAMLED